MQRICSRFALAKSALILGVFLCDSNVAVGALIRPDAEQSFPELGGDLIGTQTYTYNPVTQTGDFQVSNRPAILAVGNQPDDEYFVTNGPDFKKSQLLNIKLDSSGQIVNDPSNSYTVYGSVTIDGHTYSGLLLQGTPTAFGFAHPDPEQPAKGFYDANIHLTGGLLQPIFGPDGYMSIIAETNSTFTGSFSQSFLGLQALTDITTYNPPQVPEPSTLAIALVLGAAGLLRKHRKGFVIKGFSLNRSVSE